MPVPCLPVPQVTHPHGALLPTAPLIPPTYAVNSPGAGNITSPTLLSPKSHYQVWSSPSTTGSIPAPYLPSSYAHRALPSAPLLHPSHSTAPRSPSAASSVQRLLDLAEEAATMYSSMRLSSSLTEDRSARDEREAPLGHVTPMLPTARPAETSLSSTLDFDRIRSFSAQLADVQSQLRTLQRHHPSHLWTPASQRSLRDSRHLDDELAGGAKSIAAGSEQGGKEFSETNLMLSAERKKLEAMLDAERSKIAEEQSRLAETQAAIESMRLGTPAPKTARGEERLDDKTMSRQAYQSHEAK
jgi:hypothetical protein